MTEVFQLFVRATVQVGNKTEIGISSDCLPPKWFTKHPDTTYEQDDLPNMMRVINSAVDTAAGMPTRDSLFAWWHELYQTQNQWGREQDLAPLLVNFGVSLIERAVIDATCRALETTLFGLLQSNAAGIEFSVINPDLASVTVPDLLPESPANSIAIRHTIGMGDPLTDADIDQQTAVDDGLPLTLEQNINAYGIHYFKIKLSGDLDSDRQRLKRIAQIVTAQVGQQARFTLDANEQFQDIDSFRQHYDACRDSALLREFFTRCLLMVEQPIHRDKALDAEVRDGLQRWPDAPPIIIDESDGDLSCVPQAIDLGYSGASHKNCKGIMKGLFNAAAVHQSRIGGRQAFLSAEDLANVGPVALLQDLAMIAALGIEHAERNGHHYFAGLSWLPKKEQNRVSKQHGDLYQKVDQGFVALAPVAGRLKIQSVSAAPFGYAEAPDLEEFAVRA